MIKRCPRSHRIRRCPAGGTSSRRIGCDRTSQELQLGGRHPCLQIPVQTCRLRRGLFSIDPSQAVVRIAVDSHADEKLAVRIHAYGYDAEADGVQAVAQVKSAVLDHLLGVGFDSVLLHVVVESGLEDGGLLVWREFVGLLEVADDGVRTDVDDEGVCCFCGVVDFDEYIVVSWQQSDEAVEIFVIAFDVLSVVVFVGFQGVIFFIIFSGEQQFDGRVPFFNEGAFPGHRLAGKRQLDVDVEQSLFLSSQFKEIMWTSLSYLEEDGVFDDIVVVINEFGGSVAIGFVLANHIEFSEYFADFLVRGQKLIFDVEWFDLFLPGCEIVAEDGVLARPPTGDGTFDSKDVLIDELRGGLSQGTQQRIFFSDCLYFVAGQVGHQSELFHLLAIACFPYYDVGVVVERYFVHRRLLGLVGQSRNLQVLYLLFDRESTIARQPKCLDELEGLSLSYCFQRAFFFDPCFEQDQFPWFVDGESPDWELFLSFDGYPVIDIVNVVLSVSSDEILVISLLGECLGEESGFDVLLIEHDELGYDGGVEWLDQCWSFRGPFLVEQFQVLIVELVETTQLQGVTL